MGFFDKLINSTKDVINESQKAIKETIKDVQEQASQGQNNMESIEREWFNNPSEPLPAIPIQTRLYGKNVRFMISNDFTKYDGYTSSTVSLKYNPEHLSGLDDIDDENDITISLLEGVGDFDEIAECIEEYISNKTVSDVERFEDFPDGKYMFKAKISASGYIMYFYVLRSDASDPYDYDLLLLFYPDIVKNTNLEKKLVDCFEEAAKTLTISM